MRTYSFGYLPDLPSFQDFTPDTKDVPVARLKAFDEPPIKRMLRKVGAEKPLESELPLTSDLRPWFTPVEQQGNLGSCTSQAAAGLIEYFENRSFGSYVEAARLFIYYNSRKIAGLSGDSGSYLRSTMEAITAFGAPPENHWPYNIADFDKQPDIFAYNYGQNYKAISYYRLDPVDVTGEKLLSRIKTNLCAGLPSMFGFTVYSSFVQADTNGGKFPFPTRRDRVVGGHAIVCVGHDDAMEIRNTASATPTIGAFRIRNSWGAGWGENGYGWLPYDYVAYGLADDWWSLLKSDWIDTGQFAL